MKKKKIIIPAVAAVSAAVPIALVASCGDDDKSMDKTKENTGTKQAKQTMNPDNMQTPETMVENAGNKSPQSQDGKNITTSPSIGDGSDNNMQTPETMVENTDASQVEQTINPNNMQTPETMVENTDNKNSQSQGDKNITTPTSNLAVGDGSGNTYTQAQIDARDYSGVKPASVEAAQKAIVGLNVRATGDGSGNTYTQAAIDQVLGGDKIAPANAVVGDNGISSGTGVADGKTYAQAQIDARDYNGVMPETGSHPLVGNNAKKSNYSSGDVRNYLLNIFRSSPNYPATNPIVSRNSKLISTWSYRNIGYDEFYTTTNNVVNGRLSKSDGSILNSSEAFTKDEVWKILGDLGLRNGIEFSNVIAVDVKIPNSGSGDYSGNTYSQAAIDKFNGDVAPAGAILGLNAQGGDVIGDGSGNIYTQAQIDARDYNGVKPASVEAANKAIAGINVRATGDGSGNTYIQVAIDQALGGDRVAPANAVVGINTPASN